MPPLISQIRIAAPAPSRFARGNAMKRGFDILFSSVLLILAAPVLLLIAAAIKLSSTGPALFVQERIGLNKGRFKIYKFRTMIPDAESFLSDLKARNETGGAAFKMKNDPRVTTIGRFLRRTSLDELPQLINVLVGDMSLVGPRPLTTKDFEGFSEAHYDRRFTVKPGITCLYQISCRASLSFDHWMLLDLRYIDQRSLWLDFKILARTIPAVIRGVGAV
jgi:lipopolysaccharide/colanic/teichoic acid biosynthesis glycosyltransferase